MENKTRVVVTGLGAITPVGNDVASFWQGLKDKKVGIAPITYFDTTAYKAKLAGEVIDHAEKANSIYPSDDQRRQLRKAHLLEARASLMALDVRLTHCYLIMTQNPQGCFTTPSGKSVDAKKATERLDKMAQKLGELIDRENDLLQGMIGTVNRKA